MACWIFLLLITSLIAGTSASVKVAYLKGVSRLDNSSYKDYYFHCSSIGHTLQWDVNKFGLGGFVAGNLAGVLYGGRSNFNYTTTLLSSTTTTGGLYTFDSVLIVSVVGHHSLSVTCSNGSISDNSNNLGEDLISDWDRRSNENVLLELVLSQVIVNRTSTETPTNIFICGVNNQFMNWETSTSNYGFSIYDRPGLSSQNIRTSDITVPQQAIVLCFEPYKLVTVFIATGNSDVTVTCGYPQDYVSLNSSYFTSKAISTASKSMSTSEDPETSSSSSTSGSLMSTTTNGLSLETQNFVSPITAITLATMFTVVGSVCFLMIIILFIMVNHIYRKKKNRGHERKKVPMENIPKHVQESVSSWDSDNNEVTPTWAISSTPAA